MANMTFKTNLLPSTNLGYNLGSSDQKWNVYGNLTGNAATATKLKTARSLKTKLDSTTAITFDGSAAQDAIPVTGTLGIANGGTGATTAANARANLNVPTRTGGDASGTWGISITGSANTLAYANQLTTQEAIDGFLEASKFKVATFKTTDANNVSMASNDGMIISLPWNSTTYGAQIALDDSTAGSMKFRGKSTNWGDWRTIIHDGNYTSYTVTKTGSGASGTWGISITGSSASCTGNAATATKVGNSSCWGYFHNSNELNFGGTGDGTNIYIGYRAMDSKPIPTNVIFGGGSGSSNIKCNNVMSNATVSSTHSTYGACISMWSDSEGGNIFWRCAGSGGSASNTGYQIDTCSNVLRLYRTTNGGGAATHGATLMDSNGYASFPRVYGAVWNDYAEFRKTCNAKPGQCIIENGDGSLSLSTKRCQSGANIISDTFGFSIGKKDNYETPIAVSGRVLVYVDNKNDLKPGDALVSAPNGYCTKARWYEKILWPERIIGTVSEIPNYDIWYCGYDENEQRLVDNRIWVKVK